MPVYNGAKFIREALDSLLAQTFTDYELIISDNASTDETEAICREYAAKDERIRYVQQTENRGALANFRFVLDEAVGKYFMWAAADDWWSQDWLSAIVPLLDDQSVEIAFGETMRTKIDLSPDGPVKFYSIRNKSTAIRLLRFFMLDENTKGNLFYGLMRTPMIKAIKVYVPKKTKYGWDYLQIFRILIIGKIGHAPHVILKKRNSVIGDRRFKYNIPQLAIQYALSFTDSVSADRLNYYFEFYKLAPNALSKFIILFLIPIKIIISIGYGYARGARSGLEILQTRPNVDN
jgi:glycosyltransferase involved in cell wall biosynthesis